MIGRRIVTVLLLLAGLTPAQAQPASRPAKPVQGRIETFSDLRIVRVWGSPAARGYALGRLCGAEIVQVLDAEYGARFARQPRVLATMRSGIDRLIEYPEAHLAEIDALLEGIKDSGASLQLPSVARELDRTDLLVVNALDVLGVMACSGLTVWGDRVAGGGVLTTRNFDWPYTGKHLVENTILMVVHPEQGAAQAFVTWPGYLGAVTAVSERGIATFLHVGSGKYAPFPRPQSCPTAFATRALLEQATPADALAIATRALELTSPPASYLVRVVLPAAPPGAGPEAVFEVDSKKVVVRPGGDWCVTTNHFVERRDGRAVDRDSSGRFDELCASVQGALANGDHKVSIEEAWAALDEVDRGGRSFGTLHSLVFRFEPWHFELRVGTAKQNGVGPAPESKRRYVIPRDVLFKQP